MDGINDITVIIDPRGNPTSNQRVSSFATGPMHTQDIEVIDLTVVHVQNALECVDEALGQIVAVLHARSITQYKHQAQADASGRLNRSEDAGICRVARNGSSQCLS